MAGEVALEAADRLARSLAFACAAADVGDRVPVVFAACEHDRVQGAVELAVSAAVKSVADRLARRGGNWGAAASARPRLALEARHLPHERVMRERPSQPALRKNSKHRGRRMGKVRNSLRSSLKTRFWAAINRRETALRGG